MNDDDGVCEWKTAEVEQKKAHEAHSTHEEKKQNDYD